ncbi:hypothetical protein H9L21_07390 [Aeromicrobium senzhongii]|uniref:ABC-three component systems C-terminal domain-containing protein n=1 Tax=Aeromicrobium senzhongii TaxID=2663859 RepID=A0ABX6SWC3_9ACTN|nr:ABC-three component system protein [Aeromicrobium senzhongii]MTB87211.1 hypothetical protein [Aeromicrobium senzhongii]QNL95714.1 hypothetical protein H9L21_07390 [Aeromicrobium senzhongii]
MDYVDLPVPPDGAEGPVVPRLSPRQLVAVYEPGDWESFVHEWLQTRDGYARLVRPSGPGDEGIDVAGLADADGLEGVWDNYQCKHYQASLTPSDVYPEVYKVLRGVIKGAYVMPRKYYFVAPKGCGTKLGKLLSSPTKFRESFLKLLEDDPPAWLSTKPEEERNEVAELAATTNFQLFNEIPVADVVKEHSSHPNHAARFQVALSRRGPAERPPAEPAALESRYVEQLVDVYCERFGLPAPGTLEDVVGHDQAREHLQWQRVAFYSAEALKRFARDEVPDGTFEALADQLHAGVVNVHDDDYSSGYARLLAVLNTAGNLALGANALLPRVEIQDRHGICHQLANVDRLVWVRP